MTSGPELYYRSTAEDGIYRARCYIDQGRKARAQDTLLDAKFWAVKCQADVRTKLIEEIEALQRSIYF